MKTDLSNQKRLLMGEEFGLDFKGEKGHSKFMQRKKGFLIKEIATRNRHRSGG